MFIGALSVPVNTSQRGATLEHILADSDSVAMVFDDELRDAVLAVKGRLPSLRASVVAGGKVGGGIDWTIERLLDHVDAVPTKVIADVCYDGEPVRAKSVAQAWGEAGAAEAPGQEDDSRL